MLCCWLPPPPLQLVPVTRIEEKAEEKAEERGREMGTLGSPERSPGPGSRWPDPQGSGREIRPSGREGPGLPWIDT